MSTFGERVKECRKELKLNQEDLGKKLGMTQQAIGKIERGETKGSRKIRQMVDLFKVNLEWLMSGRGPKRSPTGDAELDFIAKEHPETYAQANMLFDRLLELDDQQIEAIANLLDAFSPAHQ